MEEKKISQYSFKELRAVCQTTAPNPARESLVGLSSRIFAIYFTKLLLIFNIGPHSTTIISVLFFFLGIGFFIFNDYARQVFV